MIGIVKNARLGTKKTAILSRIYVLLPNLKPTQANLRWVSA